MRVDDGLLEFLTPNWRAPDDNGWGRLRGQQIPDGRVVIVCYDLERRGAGTVAVGDEVRGHELGPENLRRHRQHATQGGATGEKGGGTLGIVEFARDRGEFAADRVEEVLDPVLECVQRQVGPVG